MIIKSVVTALRNHVMSCYRSPKATAKKKLTSAVAQFSWNPEACTGNHGTKYLWHLIEKPNTLFSRVFKGRYYRNALPQEPIRSY